MGTVHLQCGNAANLFYEPEGLLLRCCLLPADGEHRRHLLTFQIGYLGSGEITVDVALEGGSADGALSLEPAIVAARLRGAAARDSVPAGPQPEGAAAGVNLSYIDVPEGPVQYRYTVWGQAAAAPDSLRGQLVTEVSGHASGLTLTTRSGATRSLPRARRRGPRAGCSTEERAGREFVRGL
jgi:hypothetical protein